jgi:peptidoglycan hydrolase CwlO-like protein
MMSRHEEERENDLKKWLIIALAICVLILSACRVVQGNDSAPSSSISHFTANTQTTCSALQEQQAQLQKAIDVASIQLSSAHGDLGKAEKARNTLIRLHEPSKLVQAKLRTCTSAG